MTTKAHTFLRQFEGEAIPVLELAKFIGIDAYAMRKKAEAMNGQVNYDRENDALNTEQMVSFLPSYINGQRQLKGQKRANLLALLEALNGTNDGPTKTLTKIIKEANKEANDKPIKRPTRHQQGPTTNRQPTPTSNTNEANESQLKRSFLTNKGFLLAVVIGCVLVQSSHFALYYIGRIGTDGLAHGLTVFYGILVGLLVEAMGLILVANGRGKKWLGIIAAVSFCVNFLFYQTYKETGWDFFGELLLAAVIPGCIYLVSELYTGK